jgi:hypothetical protein
MSHAVLLGDSIFDNAPYVPGGPPVIEQLRKKLPAGWQATLLAVDGHVTADLETQLRRLPGDATHLVVSVGGNDALGQAGVIFSQAQATELLHHLAGIHERFRAIYRTMLGALVESGRPAMVCTIYDAIPDLEPTAKVGLSVFNDIILREAFAARVPVLDLRLVCTEADDYSALSPIEPSAPGGDKIAAAIAEALTGHDWSRRQSVVFP